MRQISLVLLVASCLLVAHGGSRTVGAEPSDVTAIAEDAYIFAYPMLYGYQTLYNQTQDATFPGYVGGFGQYRHYARAATPADVDIVTPNNDTTYSWAWLDLRREPIIFQTPDIDEGRYNVFQWVDLYTHIFASPGSRLTGTKGGTFMFAGPKGSAFCEFLMPDGKIQQRRRRGRLLSRVGAERCEPVAALYFSYLGMSLVPAT